MLMHVNGSCYLREFQTPKHRIRRGRDTQKKQLPILVNTLFREFKTLGEFI